MTKAIDVHCHLSTRPQYEAWGPYLDAMERYYKFRPDVRSEAEMVEDLRQRWGARLHHRLGRRGGLGRAAPDQ